MSAEADAKKTTDELERSDAAAPPKRGMMRLLYDWCLKWAETPYALPALMVMSFAEASFFPIPPDVLLLPICFAQPKKAIRNAILCTAASVVGAFLGWYIGHALWAQFHDFFIPRFFSQQKFDDFGALVRGNAFAIIALKGLTPIPFKLVTIAAGVADVPLGTFFAACVVCRSIRFGAEGVLIQLFGETVRPFIEKYLTPLFLLVLVLFVGGFAAFKFMH